MDGKFRDVSHSEAKEQRSNHSKYNTSVAEGFSVLLGESGSSSGYSGMRSRGSGVQSTQSRTPNDLADSSAESR